MREENKTMSVKPVYVNKNNNKNYVKKKARRIMMFAKKYHNVMLFSEPVPKTPGGGLFGSLTVRCPLKFNIFDFFSKTTEGIST